jgi:hypothetical protein
MAASKTEVCPKPAVKRFDSHPNPIIWAQKQLHTDIKQDFITPLLWLFKKTAQMGQALCNGVGMKCACGQRCDDNKSCFFHKVTFLILSKLFSLRKYGRTGPYIAPFRQYQL